MVFKKNLPKKLQSNKCSPANSLQLLLFVFCALALLSNDFGFKKKVHEGPMKVHEGPRKCFRNFFEKPDDDDERCFKFYAASDAVAGGIGRSGCSAEFSWKLRKFQNF